MLIYQEENQIMRLQPKTFFVKNGEAETRFNNVIKQYDTYINKILHDNRTYKIIALVAIFMIVVSVIGWFFALSLRKENLVIVEVNEIGRAKYLGKIGNEKEINCYEGK